MNTKKIAAVLVAVGLLLVAGVWYALSKRERASPAVIASGTLEATEADLGFAAAGRIASIAVREGDVVRSGQELARLDAAELEARRAVAVAHIDGARAHLAELRAGGRPQELAQARAARDAATRRLEDASRVLERSRRLEAEGVVSAEALDQAQTAYETARAQLEQAREQLSILETGARSERVAAQEALVRQAEAALQQADAALANAVIRAPFDGVVTVRHRQAGEAVGAGAPVLTLRDPADRWVRVYVREDRLGRVTLGQAARIRSDGLRGSTFDGRVSFISGQAEFTPRNVQTPEDRVRLVYMVRIAVLGDTAMQLKPGLPADVELIGREP